jgi:hypothetical protein
VAGSAKVVVAVVEAAAADADGVAELDVGAVALVGVDVADVPRDPAVLEGTDSLAVVVDGEDVEIEHCALAVAYTAVNIHTEDADMCQALSAGAPVRGGVAQGQAGHGEKPLVAVKNTGQTEESDMKPGGIVVTKLNDWIARKGVVSYVGTAVTRDTHV